MGTPDPRYTTQGHMDFQIQRQLNSYKKEDPPPDRVKPDPVTVIHWIMQAAVTAASTSNLAIADMIAIAFFYLL